MDNTVIIRFFTPDGSTPAPDELQGVIEVVGTDRFATFRSDACLVKMLRRLRTLPTDGSSPSSPDRPCVE